MAKYVKPRKSASLMIAREIINIEKNNAFDYKLLFLQRQGTVSFGNMIAFPGGNEDKEDSEYIKANSSKFPGSLSTPESLNTLTKKIVALRETYEETGLYFTKNKLLRPDQFNVIQEILNHHKAVNKMPTFYELSNLIECDTDNTKEFLRLITVPFLKSRYDCQFFITKLRSDHIINVPKAIQDFGRIDNIDELLINKSESSDYQWLNPLECLKLFMNKKIIMAPPQFMILNILTSFKKFSDIESYLNELKQYGEEYKGTDVLRKNPLTFPTLIAMINNNEEKYKNMGYQFAVTLPGDSDYPLEKVLELEKDEELRKELEYKYQSIEKGSTSRKRFYFKEINKFFGDEYEVDVQGDTFSPFKYMANWAQLAKSTLLPKL